MRANKTKIIATIGPATAKKEIITQMVEEGLDVCRLNFSHLNHDTAKKYVKTIKEVRKEKGAPLAILADLQGPKLRIGEMKKDIEVKEGDELVFTTKESTKKNELYISYLNFPMDVVKDDFILVDDGKIKLKVLSSDNESRVKTRVVQGGVVKQKKGVNLPNTKITLPSLTDKDLEDLYLAIDLGVEWIAQSFVRSPYDVEELKRRISSKSGECKVMAKIEKPEAVENIDKIIGVSDAVMVARGDLGVEMSMQNVPLIQKDVIYKCRKAAKPIVVATQMMESMIENITPTRAEANDVANSVLDGADAMMLSAETSIGNHPTEAVKNMSKIIANTEKLGEITEIETEPEKKDKRFITNSVCYNASKIADQVQAKAILTMTHSGYSGFKISSHRPNSHIFVFTHNKAILNTLSLVWGVRCFYYNKFASTDETMSDIQKIIKDKNLLKKKDTVVMIASMPIKLKGMTNTIRISEIE